MATIKSSAPGACPLEAPSATRRRPRRAHGSVHAPRSQAERGAALRPWCWTHAAGRGSVGLIGVPQGEGLGTGGCGKLGGAGCQQDFKRPAAACPQETTSSARTSPTSPRAMSWALGDPIECFLTRTGESNGRWDGRKVQMP